MTGESVVGICLYFLGEIRSPQNMCVCVQDCIQATLTLVVIGSGRTEIVRLRKNPAPSWMVDTS